MNRTAPVTGVTKGEPSKFGWRENLIQINYEILHVVKKGYETYQSITVRGTNPAQFTKNNCKLNII